MASPSHAHLRLWLRLLVTTNEMERELRRRLRREFGTTLPRFDVLAALDRVPAGLSMTELSRRLMVTNGNTTVLVAALEQDGLVRRTVSDFDRRSTTVELTAAGSEEFAQMAAAHESWVSELLAGIDADAADRLSDGLHDARLAIRTNTSAGSVA
jgi:DNA-binding MarR family transcriptional regulator